MAISIQHGFTAVDARSRDRRLASQHGSLRACSQRAAKDSDRAGEGHVSHPGPPEGPGSPGRVRQPHSLARRHAGSGGAGADVVMIDQEHGPIGPESMHAMVAATAGTTCSPWVRVPDRDEGYVKAALDAGAEGIGAAAGPVLAATNGDIHINTATADGDPDDGGQLPAARTGDVHIGS
jgi:hypothetical protein